MSYRRAVVICCDWPFGCDEEYQGRGRDLATQARADAVGDHWGQRKPESGFGWLDLCPDHKDEFDRRMATPTT